MSIPNTKIKQNKSVGLLT